MRHGTRYTVHNITLHHIAPDISADALRQGGNAVDAALAAELTPDAVEPCMTDVDGGVYMTI